MMSTAFVGAVLCTYFFVYCWQLCQKSLLHREEFFDRPLISHLLCMDAFIMHHVVDDHHT